MSGDLQLLPFGGKIAYTFDFSARVPDGVSVSSYTATIPAGLTQVSKIDDLANAKCTLILKDGLHGCVYTVSVVAVLSNGAEEPQYLTVRVHSA